jgi:putative phosphotransacetylase
MKTFKIPIEVSARHIHFSQSDLEKLFGYGFTLTKKNDVSQPGQFAANETIKLIGPKNEINGVRIVAPTRDETQLEISMTDAYNLGLDIPPVRVSGDLEHSGGGLKILGPNGKIDLTNGIIIAQRHLHIEPEKAKEFGIKDGDLIDIKIEGARSLIFQKVIVRSRKDTDKLSFQLDTDEANAADVKTNDEGEIGAIWTKS